MTRNEREGMTMRRALFVALLSAAAAVCVAQTGELGRIDFPTSVEYK